MYKSERIIYKYIEIQVLNYLFIHQSIIPKGIHHPSGLFTQIQAVFIKVSQSFKTILSNIE